MNDQPKMWIRRERGKNVYYVTIDGKQHRLGRDKVTAETKYQELIGSPGTPSMTVKRLAELFMDWNEEHKSARTTQWYKMYVDKFVEEYGQSQAFVMTPKHLEDWAKKHYDGDHGQEGAHRAIQRLYNWGVTHQHLSRNTLKGAERPKGEPRGDYLTPEQFKGLLEHVPEDDPFRDLLIVAWYTGARPQELRNAEARHFVDGEIIFPKAEAKGKKRERVVTLLGKSLDIVQRLAERFPEGPLFRYRPSKGKDAGTWKGYTSFALVDRFKRLKKDAEWEGPLCAYMFRHSFATHSIAEADMQFEEVAALMGHRDSTMIQTVYGKHRKRADYRRKLAEKAAKGLEYDS